MGKKRRIKKSNQLKQGHDPDGNIPRNTASNLDPNDFISRLPDNILYHIISSLPFQSAVRTTFLSTQWKDLWKEALLTSVRDVIMEDAVTAISSFVDDFEQDRPRNEGGVKFELGHGRVFLAAIPPNNSLQLDFSAGKQEFPRPFDWLLKLNLAPRCHWPSRWYGLGWMLEEPSCNTKKLKSLYLISVSYPSKEAVSSMVSSFPFLESLTIAKCNGLRSLQIKDARELLKLVVLDCPQLESVRFEGSNLTSFQYRGRLVLFESELSSNDDRPIFPNWSLSPFKFQLNDAMLDFRQGPPIYNGINGDCFRLILESIKNVNSLTLCRWVFEALISLVLSSLSRDSEFRLYGLTELWWIDYSMDRDNFNSLLIFLKLCPCLERLYLTIDPESYNMGSTKQRSSKVNGLRKLNHLKLLKLEGFANGNKEILFAKRLRPFFRMKPVILAKSKGTYRDLFAPSG
ncbi:F-box family protein, putative [Theobroma cacao]|uniref:F-box family protein, putative n=1 Tax=Theobroma cacao TaxID=3641 RepID=A0A061FMC7_THECC|nr:F-box family protein, putative [Theobroma cacao]